METIRVLYFSSGYSSVHEQIVDSIRKQGHEVLVCLYTLHGSMSEYKCPSNSVFYKCESNKRGMFDWKKRLDDIAYNINKMIDWNTVDILHGHLLYTDGYICRKLSEINNKPYVVALRNTDINTKYYRLPWIKKQMLMNASKSCSIMYLGENYKIQLLSRIKKETRGIVEKKMIYIPNGIDIFWHQNINKPKHLKQDRVIRLITVGRVEKNKNQIIVKKAAEELWIKGYKVYYTVVGYVVDTDLKKQLVEKKWISLFSHMSKEELIRYYRMSDIYIMPSLTETFGLVYAEALSQGLPIIYSKGQGFDKQFPEGEVGYHVNSNNYFEIADTIIKIINNYEQLSENAIRGSHRFNWRSVGSKFGKVYKNSLDEYNYTI